MLQTDLEYQTQILTYRQTNHSLSSDKVTLYQPDFSLQLPTSLDWRSLGAVTKVKDQVGSSSCEYDYLYCILSM